MNVICSYSSLSFSCEHFPGIAYGNGIYHPVFHLPQKKLLSLLPKFFAGELTQTDSYLLYLAALRSSDLVQFRVPAIRTEHTSALVSNHLEHLFQILCKLNAVSNPAVVFPKYVISQDTKDLSSTPYWIQNWSDAYESYLSGARNNSAHDLSKLNRRLAALERMIKNPHKQWNEYSRTLAEWTSTAAEFPEFSTVSRFTSQPCTLKEYWIEIIVRCASESQVYTVNENDLLELTNHCRTNMEIGTIYSHRLFEILGRAEDKVKNFLGLGDLDIPSNTDWKFVSPNESVEISNARAIIMSAPTEAPRPENYPSKFQYLKAKMNYEMALKYGDKKEEKNTVQSSAGEL